MTLLLADVGGTNSRLALSEGEAPDPATIARFRNDDFADFEAVLAAFLARHPGLRVERACVAVAGPVLGETARLTNRAWTFRPDRLSAVLGGAPVTLLNDLAALALSMPYVAPEPLTSRAPAVPDRDGQSVVVGMGTGFNAAILRGTPSGVVVLATEFGHAALPCTVAAALGRAAPDAQARFRSNEDAFAGRGLAAFCTLAAGCTGAPAELLARAASAPDGPLGQAVSALSGALGTLMREILNIYMPDRGIVLAGSVARGLLAGPARRAFLAAYGETGAVGLNPAEVPLGLVTDDCAALWGCLAHLRAGR